MKTASMILGIVGGAMACLTGVTFILLGCAWGSTLWGLMPSDFPADAIFNTLFTTYLVFGILALAAGGVGLTGGLLIKQKEKTAGVLLIIGAALSFSIPLILAAIFAFVKEKAPTPAYGCPLPYPYPPYPPYAPQYPPYPYAPYPPQYPPYPPQQAPSAPASGSGNPAGDEPQA